MVRGAGFFKLSIDFLRFLHDEGVFYLAQVSSFGDGHNVFPINKHLFPTLRECHCNFQLYCWNLPYLGNEFTLHKQIGLMIPLP